MRILFWGTPEFAVPALLALVGEGFDIVGVVTQPDRPAGRGRRMQPSPVRRAALEEDLTVLTPERPKGEDFLSSIGDLQPDVSIVVAYGHILRTEVLELPRLGSLNLHASLLPKLRGAAPVNWAIARGYEETGVTVMRMVEAMDAGPILHQVSERILPDETAGELTERLSEVGAAALVEGLALLTVGAVEEVEQDHGEATYAPKIDRETARIDWSRPAIDVANHIRAMDPVPGAWTTLDEAPVKLFRPRPTSDRAAGHRSTEEGVVAGSGADPRAPEPRPGRVLGADPSEGVRVQAGSGSVLLGEVQPPGSRRMVASDWINGRGIAVGQTFG
ncbi:MAG: methionyl-tRNA formyltransferase [Gemmatimonadota bacterium]|nr:methionyl-tRNA formyltransferase [Gemmatimonadota bacterium]